MKAFEEGIHYLIDWWFEERSFEITILFYQESYPRNKKREDFRFCFCFGSNINRMCNRYLFLSSLAYSLNFLLSTKIPNSANLEPVYILNYAAIHLLNFFWAGYIQCTAALVDSYKMSDLILMWHRLFRPRASFDWQVPLWVYYMWVSQYWKESQSELCFSV